jgi:transcriptional regulator with XRE-family HTH domain
LLSQISLWRLGSAPVTSEEELQARRLGYWLRRVRERQGISLKSAALAAGLAASSGSTVSMWEHGKREISVQQLRRLARFYGVPESLFIGPPMTDEERLDTALADAAALERGDWGSGEGPGPVADDGPGGGRRTPLQ